LESPFFRPESEVIECQLLYLGSNELFDSTELCWYNALKVSCINMLNRPVYPIGVVAEMLNVHPETIRVWERAGVVQPPQRRGGKRFYSEEDLKRLQFIQKLTSEGLNLPAINHYLKLYPCWNMHDCPGCMRRTQNAGCAKSCWREEGTYCMVSGDDNLCADCQLHKNQKGQCTPPEPEQTPKAA